ncbi:hypothetical protein Bca4012_002828 [Brassica carinata]
MFASLLLRHVIKSLIKEKKERTVSFCMLLTSPWLAAISTVTVHFATTFGNSITFKSLKLLAMSFAEYEEAEEEDDEQQH